MKKYVLFIGIDISKDWIDVALTIDGQIKQMPHRRFANNLKGYEQMMKWIRTKPLANAWLFCMEHTGIYSLKLCRFLQQHKQDFVLQSALHIQRCLGITRGKDDKADAKRIARYAYLYRNELKISVLPAQSLQQLKDLMAYRNRLVKKRQSLKVSSNELALFSPNDQIVLWIKRDSDENINHLTQSIKQTEAKMMKIVKQDAELSRLYKLVTSVKGVGPITAIQLLVYTKAFKAFESARQLASYIGVAPFSKRSGKSLNSPATVSHLKHKKLKALLGNCVMIAIRYDKELKAYYRRKIEQGKIKYVVFNAVKNKLLARVFATVKRGTPYVELLRYA